jgi:hypothetical protein
MTATPRDDTRTPQPSHPTFGEILKEVINLSTGLAVALLPLFVLSVAGIILLSPCRPFCCSRWRHPWP